jgi:ligand-binding sensor domain-containing protein/signal transduction histidine kinase
VLLAAACIAATGWSGSSAGQVIVPDEPVFVWRGLEEGLSHASVYALLQDETGFLWIGTAGGLNRFDGVEFRVYTHQPDSAHSLGDDHVRALARSNDGRLWVGTERGGLNRFDPSTGRADRFDLFELGPWATDAFSPANDQRRGRTVSAIVPGRDGSVLLATDLGLVHFDPESARATRVGPAIVHPDPAGIPLCGLPDGRAVAALPGGEVVLVDPTGTSIRALARPGEAISSLRCHAADRVYAGTARGHLYALEVARETVQHLGRVGGQTADSLEVHDVTVGPDGDLWIGTGQGLFVMHSGTNVSRRIGLSGRGRLVDAQINRFLTDASGMLWIGTWNGLAGVHPASLAMQRIFNGGEDAAGLLGRGVVSIHSAGADELWLGTYDNGVVVLRRTDGGWSPMPVPALAPLAGAFVFDLTVDQNGVLWIATLRDGIFRLDPSRAELSSVAVETIAGEEARTLLYSVFVDRAGGVWAGSETLGLLRYDDRREVFVEHRGPGQTWNYGSSYVWPIAEDAAGNLWIGAFNGGLSRIDARRETLRLYAPTADGLRDARILTILPDSRGRVWIGTEGGGLYRLDPSSERFVHYSAREGLPHDNIEAIVEDLDANLWISTSDGIARLDPETGAIRVLKESAGLTGNRFFANSAVRTSRGEVLFGGPGGVTIIYPSLFTGEDFRPNVAVTRFRIRTEEALLARIRPEDGLDLGPQESFFTFEFAAMDFRQPALNRYRYQLVGLDDDWIEAGTSRIANYTSVPPRRYTFRVQAMNAEGLWSAEPLSIPVRVRPPYHRTWWFRSAVAAAVAALVIGFFLYRLKELQRRQDLRLGIAGKLHDDIGANLAAIALKAEMIGQASELDGKRRDQLADVGRLARETTLQLRETVWVVNTQYDTLPGVIAKMRDTAEMILGDHIEYEFGSPENLPDRPLDMERRQSFYLVFKEALQNIVKHSGANSVKIVVSFDARHLSCTVRDDGKGFDPSTTNRGNGLELMRKRALRHGGELTVASTPAAGTTVTFRIRMG